MVASKRSNKMNIRIPIPSAALKRFIEEILQDEEFFTRALENPIHTLHTAGIEVNPADFSAQDFAHFFGALSRLKEATKGSLKETSFDNIFSNAAELLGTEICAEFNRGFFKEWDNRDAHLQKTKTIAVNKNFFQERSTRVEAERSIISNRFIQNSQQTNKQLTQARAIQAHQFAEVNANISFSGQQDQKASTEFGWDTDWARNDQRRDKGAKEYHDKDFAGITKPGVDNILQGPLIHPSDLVRIAARIEVLVSANIAEKN